MHELRICLLRISCKDDSVDQCIVQVVADLICRQDVLLPTLIEGIISKDVQLYLITYHLYSIIFIIIQLTFPTIEDSGLDIYCVSVLNVGELIVTAEGLELVVHVIRVRAESVVDPLEVRC